MLLHEKEVDFGERIAVFVGVAAFLFIVFSSLNAFRDYLFSMFSYSADATISGAADLAAQQSMTRAAWAMVYSTAIQAIVGGIGLWALILTLRHAAAANDIAERTAQVQLTPYIIGNFRHIWQFGEEGTAIGVAIIPSWKNVGHTLALKVAIHTGLRGGDEWWCD